MFSCRYCLYIRVHSRHGNGGGDREDDREYRGMQMKKTLDVMRSFLAFHRSYPGDLVGKITFTSQRHGRATTPWVIYIWYSYYFGRLGRMNGTSPSVLKHRPRHLITFGYEILMWNTNDNNMFLHMRTARENCVTVARGARCCLCASPVSPVRM